MAFPPVVYPPYQFAVETSLITPTLLAPYSCRQPPACVHIPADVSPLRGASEALLVCGFLERIAAYVGTHCCMPIMSNERAAQQRTSVVTVRFARVTVWSRASDLEEVHDSALEYDAFEQVSFPAPRHNG